MGRKTIPGLIWRGGVWHVDKRICGRRVCQSTGSAEIQEAERYLARLMEQTRQAHVYGVRPSRTFEQAAAKFVLENQHKRSIGDDVYRLKGLMPLIGHVPLDKLHMGTMQSWIESKQRKQRAVGTINHGLQLVRRILNVASTEWIDEQGLTWLHAPAKIKLLANNAKIMKPVITAIVAMPPGMLSFKIDHISVLLSFFSENGANRSRYSRFIA